MNPEAEDTKFMREALRLAESMRGRTSPDPMVGCCIVKNGKIISRGYHAEFSTPHAEAFAIKKAKGKIQGATLYVNLEPCCHFGNNPPCTSNIIHSKIKRVVGAMEDPNSLVAGKGFNELRQAGIEVKVGVLEEEAKKLNEVFIKYITTNQPFVILKGAVSLDGKIATKTGESFWISGMSARKYSHWLRGIVDGVMVGIETILKDNPELTVRETEEVFGNPYKIILDSRGRTPLNSKVLSGEPEKTLIVTTLKCPPKKIKSLKATGARVLIVKEKNGRIDLPALLGELGKKKITSILIEGGGKINASAISSDIVDKILLFIAPKIIGGSTAPTLIEGEGISKLSEAANLKILRVERLGEDILIEGEVVK